MPKYIFDVIRSDIATIVVEAESLGEAKSISDKFYYLVPDFQFDSTGHDSAAFFSELEDKDIPYYRHMIWFNKNGEMIR